MTNEDDLLAAHWITRPSRFAGGDRYLEVWSQYPDGNPHIQVISRVRKVIGERIVSDHNQSLEWSDAIRRIQDLQRQRDAEGSSR